jgi:hypothetical protein
MKKKKNTFKISKIKKIKRKNCKDKLIQKERKRQKKKMRNRN